MSGTRIINTSKYTSKHTSKHTSKKTKGNNPNMSDSEDALYKKMFDDIDNKNGYLNNTDNRNIGSIFGKDYMNNINNIQPHNNQVGLNNNNLNNPQFNEQSAMLNPQYQSMANLNNSQNPSANNLNSPRFNEQAAMLNPLYSSTNNLNSPRFNEETGISNKGYETSKEYNIQNSENHKTDNSFFIDNVKKLASI